MARILLVDDNAELLKLQGEVLRREGHVVTMATEGNEALLLVQNSVFDLVITDLVMPVREGIETIVELRRIAPSLKIIAMSGGGKVDAKDYLTIARQLGAVQTLAKPFSKKDLLEAVSGVLGGAA